MSFQYTATLETEHLHSKRGNVLRSLLGINSPKLLVSTDKSTELSANPTTLAIASFYAVVSRSVRAGAGLSAPIDMFALRQDGAALRAGDDANDPKKCFNTKMAAT